MKRIVFLCAITALTFSLFSSCTAIDNLLSKEIQLGKKSLQIPISLEGLRADGDFQSFTGSYDKLNLDSDLYGDLEEYKEYPIEIILKSVTIKLTREEGVTGGSSVMNLKSFAMEDGSEKFTFSTPTDEEIDLSSPYSNENLNKYLKDILERVQEGGTLYIEVNGMTDIVPVEGDQLVGKIEFNMELSAKVRYLDLL